eukprot:gene4973-10016_t
MAAAPLTVDVVVGAVDGWIVLDKHPDPAGEFQGAEEWLSARTRVDANP